MYKKGGEQEEEVKLIENLEKAEENDEGEELARKMEVEKREMIRKFNEREFDLEDEDLDKEVSELISWSENLDYDSYVKDWYQVSTSESSANFVPKPVYIPDKWCEWFQFLYGFPGILFVNLSLLMPLLFLPTKLDTYLYVGLELDRLCKNSRIISLCNLLTVILLYAYPTFKNNFITS